MQWKKILSVENMCYATAWAQRPCKLPSIFFSRCRFIAHSVNSTLNNRIIFHFRPIYDLLHCGNGLRGICYRREQNRNFAISGVILRLAKISAISFEIDRQSCVVSKLTNSSFSLLAVNVPRSFGIGFGAGPNRSEFGELKLSDNLCNTNFL